MVAISLLNKILGFNRISVDESNQSDRPAFTHSPRVHNVLLKTIKLKSLGGCKNWQHYIFVSSFLFVAFLASLGVMTFSFVLISSFLLKLVRQTKAFSSGYGLMRGIKDACNAWSWRNLGPRAFYFFFSPAEQKTSYWCDTSGY